MNEIFNLSYAGGVLLTKSELLALSNVRIDTLKVIITKFAAKKKTVTMMEVCIDRSVANSLWSIWKSAKGSQTTLKAGQTYNIRLSSSVLFAVRSCAMKIYQALEDKAGVNKMGGEDVQALKEAGNRDKNPDTRTFMAVVRHAKKEPTLDETVLLKGQGLLICRVYPDDNMAGEILDSSETALYTIRSNTSLADLQVSSKLVDAFGTENVTLIDLDK